MRVTVWGLVQMGYNIWRSPFGGVPTRLHLLLPTVKPGTLAPRPPRRRSACPGVLFRFHQAVRQPYWIRTGGDGMITRSSLAVCASVALALISLAGATWGLTECGRSSSSFT